MTRRDLANWGHALNVAAALFSIAMAPRGKKGEAAVVHGLVALGIEFTRWAKDDAAA